MSTYTVTFDRIGRTHDVKTLVADVACLDDLVEAVYRYARPFLMSRDVDVVVENVGPGEDQARGAIFCGFRCGGTFTATTGGDR